MTCLKTEVIAFIQLIVLIYWTIIIHCSLQFIAVANISPLLPPLNFKFKKSFNNNAIIVVQPKIHYSFASVLICGSKSKSVLF